MSPRRKTDGTTPKNVPQDDDVTPPADADGDEEDEDEEAEVDVEADLDIEPIVEEVVLEEDDDDDLDEDDEDDDEDDEEEDLVEVSVAIPPRPAAKPSPGRPPSAKEEPEPPFWIGERVVLVKNTRPRTGSPIGDHPVGATGRVETVLSQTAIVRFDRAPDTKEVVAFECLESLDEVAKAARAEREVEKAAEAAAREREAAKDGAAKKAK
jgi:hypothetical protein